MRKSFETTTTTTTIRSRVRRWMDVSDVNVIVSVAVVAVSFHLII